LSEESKRIRVLPGARTFGETVQPHGGRSQSRSYWLRVRSEERLEALIVKGDEADRLANRMPPIGWRDRRTLAEHAAFSRLPDWRRLLVMRRKRIRLAGELEALSGSPPAKRMLLAPVIERQIAELDDDIMYLAAEVGEVPAP
jgi:hypothetical protein